MSLNRRMSDAHEKHLNRIFWGSRVTPGSGNQPANPMDVRQSRYFRKFAWVVEGKSTLGKSIAITREMIRKAREQAHGERPVIAVRFYDDERLKKFDDWYLIHEDDLRAILYEVEDQPEYGNAAEWSE